MPPPFYVHYDAADAAASTPRPPLIFSRRRYVAASPPAFCHARRYAASTADRLTLAPPMLADAARERKENAAFAGMSAALRVACRCCRAVYAITPLRQHDVCLSFDAAYYGRPIGIALLFAAYCRTFFILPPVFRR